MKTITARIPSFTGKFYPEEERDVLAQIRNLQKQAVREASAEVPRVEKINGLIVPHAGWRYSGKTATVAYGLLEKARPEKIALLGPAHAYHLEGIAADDHNRWMTPLGSIDIIHDDFFEVNNAAHRQEHSLEVQMPLIRHFAPEADVLPLVVGDLDTFEAEIVAAHLIEEGYFPIFSTDLSHFHSLKSANEIDRRSITNIERLTSGEIDACGRYPLRIAFSYCRMTGSKPLLLDYTTSAETTGNTHRVVGYASFVI
jgi:AmmeMemoRadiSam system protein B